MSPLVSPAELTAIQAQLGFETRVLLTEIFYSDGNYLIIHLVKPLSNPALFADIIIQAIDGLIEL
jgi:hypothetical protein